MRATHELVIWKRVIAGCSPESDFFLCYGEIFLLFRGIAIKPDKSSSLLMQGASYVGNGHPHRSSRTENLWLTFKSQKLPPDDHDVASVCH